MAQNVNFANKSGFPSEKSATNFLYVKTECRVMIHRCCLGMFPFNLILWLKVTLTFKKHQLQQIPLFVLLQQ